MWNWPHSGQLALQIIQMQSGLELSLTLSEAPEEETARGSPLAL